VATAVTSPNFTETSPLYVSLCATGTALRLLVMAAGHTRLEEKFVRTVDGSEADMGELLGNAAISPNGVVDQAEPVRVHLLVVCRVRQSNEARNKAISDRRRARKVRTRTPKSCGIASCPPPEVRRFFSPTRG
jgi:hypothetical protein